MVLCLKARESRSPPDLPSSDVPALPPHDLYKSPAPRFPEKREAGLFASWAAGFTPSGPVTRRRVAAKHPRRGIPPAATRRPMSLNPAFFARPAAAVAPDLIG